MEGRGRYFEGDSPALVKRLEDHFERMREAWALLPVTGDALVLGGGYGRGEGGVLDTDEGQEFFNDLDYFLFTDEPNSGALGEWIREWEQIETQRLGVDVEVKALPVSDVEEGLAGMMFADLVAGHVTVAGDGEFLTKLEARVNFETVGAEEATRLLWNRGSGLFFARQMMEDRTFVVRNHSKMKLALGDAWLCVRGRYDSRCRVRGERFAACELPRELEHLRQWHRDAVEFKFRPVVSQASETVLREESELLARAWSQVFLQVEQERLATKELDLAGYLQERKLFPQSPSWRNMAMAVRDRLKRSAFLRPVADYPRGALMRALPCLLSLGGRSPDDAAEFLPAPGAGETWHQVYERWWHRYC